MYLKAISTLSFVSITSFYCYSNFFRLLAHLYAAECLVLLDNIPDALEHLNLENVKDLSFELQPDESSEEGLLKTNPPASQYKIIIIF